MNPATAAHLARLQALADSAGRALYERAGLALAVLDDAEWIAENHNGNRRYAEEEIADSYFPDVAMTGWFERMLILRKHFAEAVWEEHRFNLQRLWTRIW